MSAALVNKRLIRTGEPLTRCRTSMPRQADCRCATGVSAIPETACLRGAAGAGEVSINSFSSKLPHGSAKRHFGGTFL